MRCVYILGYVLMRRLNVDMTQRSSVDLQSRLVYKVENADEKHKRQDRLRLLQTCYQRVSKRYGYLNFI